MKKAFTMIELVFVIVVIGILAAVIIPSTRTNPVQEAAIQLLSHIRYTQHLAMVDDKYDTNNLDSTGAVKWYKERWQLVFGTNTNSASVPAYTIFSDTAGDSTGDISDTEVAVNPSNASQIMTGGTTGSVSMEYAHSSFIGMKKLNLGRSYGITSYGLSGGCSGARVAFDYLGRPIKGDLSDNSEPYESDNLIQSRCSITLTAPNESIVIAIEPETGYSCILDASNNCI